MSKRTEMIDEANDLGIEFKGNVSNVNLAALIAVAKGEPEPIDEVAPAGPAMKAEPESSEEPSIQQAARTAAEAKYALKRAKVAAARKKAFRTHVVTLTNKDNRENDIMTTAYLSFENQHFGLAKLVPLDVPVELEEALIKIAANCTMTLHKDEIVDGKRTGNKVPTTVKKYAISYSRHDPS